MRKTFHKGLSLDRKDGLGEDCLSLEHCDKAASLV